MNQYIDLYSWIRSGASIYSARIIDKLSQQDAAGQEEISLKLRVEETFWGVAANNILNAKYHQPISELARLKFPDPIWGQITVCENTLILIVTNVVTDTLTDPIYVGEINDPDDPIILAIRDILKYESIKTKAKDHFNKYIEWVNDISSVKKLYAINVLAKDKKLINVVGGLRIASKFADVFVNENDEYVRLTLVTYMWEDIYPLSNRAGKNIILNAIIKGVVDTKPDIRDLCLEFIINVDPKDLKKLKLPKHDEFIARLEEVVKNDIYLEERAQIQKIIDELRK